MSRRIWWLLLAAIVLCPVVVARSETKTNGVTVGVRSGEKFNPAASGESTYVRRWVPRTLANGYTQNDSAVWVPPAQRLPIPMTVGGVDYGDTTAWALKTDDQGRLQMIDADRPEDRSPLTNLLTSSVAANTLVSTNVIDASQYTSFQIHMSWTVGTTLADTSKCDSVAFLLIPFSRTTYLDSGQNFIMAQGRFAGATGDTTTVGLTRTLPGILVTPRRNPLVTGLTPLGATIRYERIVWADFGASTAIFGPALPGLRVLEKNYQLVKSVSFPLGGSAYGGDVKEPFLGFYVYNLSKTIAATSVTIDVFPKVN